jgi:hypothetical protein
MALWNLIEMETLIHVIIIFIDCAITFDVNGNASATAQSELGKIYGACSSQLGVLVVDSFCWELKAFIVVIRCCLGVANRLLIMLFGCLWGLIKRTAQLDFSIFSIVSSFTLNLLEVVIILIDFLLTHSKSEETESYENK